MWTKKSYTKYFYALTYLLEFHIKLYLMQSQTKKNHLPLFLSDSNKILQSLILRKIPTPEPQ